MKRKMFLVVSILLLALSVVGFVACQNDDNTSEPSTPGGGTTYNVDKVEIGSESVWSSSSITADYVAEELNYLNISETATSGIDYSFYAPTQIGYEFEVTASIGGTAYDLAPAEDGVYTIPGEDITGDIVLTSLRHIAGIDEKLSGKNSFTYTDGDGIYDLNGNPVTSNGNKVTYEGVYLPGDGGYFRVTAVVDSVDAVGRQNQCDNVQIWFRDRTTGQMLEGEYIGINGVFYGASAVTGIQHSSYYQKSGDKYIEIFEIYVPQAGLSTVRSGNDLYATLLYNKSPETESTCVFAGKGSEGGDDYSKYWAVVDGRFEDKGVNGFGNAVLINNTGAYDMYQQAEMYSDVSVDGALDDTAWAEKTGETYSFDDGNKITYKGFTSEKGIFIGVTINSKTLAGLDNTETALRLNFPDDANSSGVQLRLFGLYHAQKCIGAASVKITKQSDGSYTSVIEGYIPYLVLQAKRSNYDEFVKTDADDNVTSVDISMYFKAPAMKVSVSAGTESDIWLPEGKIPSSFNFTLNQTGLTEKGTEVVGDAYDVIKKEYTYKNVWSNSTVNKPDYQPQEDTYFSVPDKAVAGKQFTFEQPIVDGYTFAVTATVAGKPYELQPAQNGRYTIPAEDVTGEIELTIIRHIEGIEKLENKASYSYTDGAGVYDANGNLVTSNGNAVQYEGFYDDSGAYFRVTVKRNSYDDIGGQATSDHVQIWVRDDAGSLKSIYVGLSGIAYGDLGTEAFSWSAYRLPEENQKVTSVFEIFVPSDKLSSYVNNSNLYATVSYVLGDVTENETCVFAGKALNDPTYWSIFGTTLGNKADGSTDTRLGFGYSTLLTANGIYDFNGQAKLNDGVVIDGKLDDSAWTGKATVSYAQADNKRSVTYAGFTGKEGFYYGATVKIDGLPKEGDTNNGLLIRFVSNTDYYIHLNFRGTYTGYNSFGTGSVFIEKQDDGWSVTFEGYVPYSVLRAKRADYQFEEGDLDVLMYVHGSNDYQFNGMWLWLDNASYLWDKYNFNIGNTGLSKIS